MALRCRHHAVSSMVFFRFLRAGSSRYRERKTLTSCSTSFCLEDVSVDSFSNPTMVCIRLKQSKTDPFRHGEDVVSLGRTDSDLCPVACSNNILCRRSAIRRRPPVRFPRWSAPPQRQARTSCAPGIVLSRSGHVRLLWP